MTEQKIVTFQDLNVYQRTYKDAITVAREILPHLPETEKYDLCSQLGRSSKAVPRLIAEGYAKRNQKKGFQRYLTDAMGECNETVVSLLQVKDIYPDNIDVELCQNLIESYAIAGKQLYRLEEAWTRVNNESAPTT